MLSRLARVPKALAAYLLTGVCSSELGTFFWNTDSGEWLLAGSGTEMAILVWSGFWDCENIFCDGASLDVLSLRFLFDYKQFRSFNREPDLFV